MRGQGQEYPHNHVHGRSRPLDNQPSHINARFQLRANLQKRVQSARQPQLARLVDATLDGRLMPPEVALPNPTERREFRDLPRLLRPKGVPQIPVRLQAKPEVGAHS